MLSGEFAVTLDDMGRISLPRRLRDIVEKSKIVLLKGADPCLWLYTADQWETREQAIIDANRENPFSSNGRRMRQHFIGSMQPVDIDKQGRILVPPTLREYAGLSKECLVMGQYDYIEIWAEDRYKQYLEATEEDFRAGLEKLSIPRANGKDLGDGGNSTYPGAAGADAGVSGPEGEG